MTALRDLLTRKGFDGVRTLLQSGNIVFESEVRGAAALELSLSREVAASLGVETDVFVRTGGEWRSILNENPFPREAERDPGHLHVAFLKEAPAAEAWAALRAAIVGRERFEGLGRHAYIVYPDGSGRSKLTPTLIERKLGTRSTSRNWNTVSKLDALASD
jgi:uncharacterized protein (DUF1697 family)